MQLFLQMMRKCSVLDLGEGNMDKGKVKKGKVGRCSSFLLAAGRAAEAVELRRTQLTWSSPTSPKAY